MEMHYDQTDQSYRLQSALPPCPFTFLARCKSGHCRGLHRVPVMLLMCQSFDVEPQHSFKQLLTKTQPLGTLAPKKPLHSLQDYLPGIHPGKLTPQELRTTLVKGMPCRGTNLAPTSVEDLTATIGNTATVNVLWLAKCIPHASRSGQPVGVLIWLAAYNTGSSIFLPCHHRCRLVFLVNFTVRII